MTGVRVAGGYVEGAMSLMTLLIILLVVAVLFGGFGGRGPVGWSPLGIVLVLILILYLTGHRF